MTGKRTDLWFEYQPMIFEVCRAIGLKETRSNQYSDSLKSPQAICEATSRSATLSWRFDPHNQTMSSSHSAVLPLDSQIQTWRIESKAFHMIGIVGSFRHSINNYQPWLRVLLQKWDVDAAFGSIGTLKPKISWKMFRHALSTHQCSLDCCNRLYPQYHLPVSQSVNSSQECGRESGSFPTESEYVRKDYHFLDFV